MKSKKDTQLLTALALILAVALAPVSTAAFAQEDQTDAVDDFDEVDVAEPVDSSTDEASTDNVSDEVDETDREKMRDEIREKMRDIREQTKEKIRELKEQRADKIRDFKEKMSDQYKDRIRDAGTDVRPYDFDPDREPDLRFDGGADGWAMIGGYAYDASTKLVGEAYHVRGSVWKVHVTEGSTISIGDRTGIPVELTGTAHGHRLMLHGTAEISEGVHVKIALRGHYAATQTEGVFALSLDALGYHTDSNNGRIPLAQVGQVSVWANENVPDAVVPQPAPIEVPEILS